LIKVILSLQHRTIPPSLHYHSPNPHIAFDELKLKVNKELTEWPSGENAALAGVSSFGFGGTNVHMIIREAPQKKQKEEKKRKHSTVADFHLLPLSANSPSALHSLARAFRKLLAPGSPFAASDICHSASRRRSQFDYRLAVVGSSNEELISGLQAFENGEPHPNLFYAGDIAPRPRKLAFVFSGQGGQWLGMCRQLLKQGTCF
jgi:acyl transferase domain-containing protein